ncbi:MAG: exosortase system-associated protein, TIGR04073 family [Geobacteraceae bacterium]
MFQKRRFSSLVALSAVIVLWLPALAGAQSSRDVENSSPQDVVDAMSTKAVRGLANITTGWLEFPKQIYLTCKEDGVGKAVFVGPLKGLGMTLVRTVSGVGETATFFLAFPGFFDPYFEPPYVWQKE